MRLTDLFTRTLRDVPAEAELASHQLVLRAGLVRPVAAGIYALMPLGLRVMHKLETILREEMDAAGGQEVRLPVVQPADIWHATGRWFSFGPALQTFSNDAGREFALGPTHEDVVAMLALREIGSYKQLPQLLYQIQTKYRNELRARGGLVRMREFTMKDAYSLDTDFDALDVVFERMVAAYHAIFRRADLDVVQIEADSGAMGGKDSHEFVLEHKQGEDSFVRCDACGYAANIEKAEFVLPDIEEAGLDPVQKVATPDCKTIQAVADFVGVPTVQTLKAVFFVREFAREFAREQHQQPDQFVFVVIRGDLEVNEVKLVNALGGGELRAATDEEILAVGAVPGYASPLGLGDDVLVVADRSVEAGQNFVAGANEDGYHLTGVNVPRDFQPGIRADIAEAFDGARCGRCADGTLRLQRAIELGHCFKLGTYYSDRVGITYTDDTGAEHPVVMGSYGIGLERLLAAIIDTHHDDWGIIWPVSVAPFDVHLLTLGSDDRFVEVAAELYAELRAAGLDVLLDDRKESAGIKFTDADLIGLPLRLAVSKKSLAQDSVEAKWRAARDRQMVPLAEVVGWAQERFAGG
ncbi:MAG: proline--tRNA ligase [Chloroflexi bacterium]|nr:proline--tRNA ligase [Chloroflexota bacterium]